MIKVLNWAIQIPNNLLTWLSRFHFHFYCSGGLNIFLVNVLSGHQENNWTAVKCDGVILSTKISCWKNLVLREAEASDDQCNLFHPSLHCMSNCKERWDVKKEILSFLPFSSRHAAHSILLQSVYLTLIFSCTFWRVERESHSKCRQSWRTATASWMSFLYISDASVSVCNILFKFSFLSSSLLNVPWLFLFLFFVF